MTLQPPQLSPFLTQKSHQENMYDPKTLSSHTNNHQNLRYRASNLAEKDQNLSQKHEDGYVKRYNFHQEAMRNDQNSGVNSPTQWKNSPSHPLLSHRSLSPNSRAEAIVRGQWELMEMVKNMPESSYELTLKDLVENQRVETDQSPETGDGSVDRKQSLQQRSGVKVKREESKKIDRNLSFENKGLFLNMAFPFSLNSKKKNKSVKVSPKPEGFKGGGERDLWKKKFTGSSDSDSSRTSCNSGSSGSTGSGSSGRSGGGGGGGGDIGGRKRNGCLTGCWPFFHSRRSKSAE